MARTYRTLDEHLRSTLADRDRALGYLQLAIDEFEQNGDVKHSSRLCEALPRLKAE